MTRLILYVIIYVTSISFLTAQSTAPNLLIDETINESGLNANQLKNLGAIANLKTTKKLRVVRVNEEAILSDNIIIRPFEDHKILIQRNKVIVGSDSNLSWMGVGNDSYATANMVFNEGNLTATFSDVNNQYKIYPLSDGLHVVVLIDPKDYPTKGCEINSHSLQLFYSQRQDVYF